MLGERFVEVVAPKARVPGGGLDLDDTLQDLEDRHVERAAAEIEHDGAHLAMALVKPVGHRRRRGLVDDALCAEPRDRRGGVAPLPAVPGAGAFTLPETTVHDARNGRSRCPKRAFTMERNDRSRCREIGVHDAAKHAT
jgi:hypothetical protein